jgi:hypothetical protein
MPLSSPPEQSQPPYSGSEFEKTTATQSRDMHYLQSKSIHGDYHYYYLLILNILLFFFSLVSDDHLRISVLIHLCDITDTEGVAPLFLSQRTAPLLLLQTACEPLYKLKLGNRNKKCVQNFVREAWVM